MEQAGLRKQSCTGLYYTLLTGVKLLSISSEKYSSVYGSSTETVMSFLPADMDSRLPSRTAHSLRGRAAGYCGPPEASPLDHTGSPPPVQRAHL